MSYKNNMRQGSFRGIPFMTDSTSLSGGRRTSTHEYPQNDVPFVEDLGKKAKSFPCEMLVIDDDYFIWRDSLLAALDDSGPGELIHPFFGEMIVQVDTYTLSETTREGRVARFSVTFLQTGNIEYPRTKYNFFERLKFQFKLTVEKNTENFISKFNKIVNYPKSFNNYLNNVFSFFDSTFMKTKYQIDSLIDLQKNYPYYLTTPDIFSYELSNYILSKKDIPGSWKEYLVLFDKVLNQNDVITDDFTKNNIDQVNDLILISSISCVCKNLLLSTFETTEDFKSAVLNVDNRFNKYFFDNNKISFELYNTLNQLRTCFLAAARENESLYPQEKIINIPYPIPLLAFEYEMFGNIDNTENIIRRNKISDPTLLESGSSLRVTDEI